MVFMGHALMENRNGPVVGAVAARASGHAERLAALALIEPRAERPGVTLGADKGYDTADFVMELREQAVTPHVAQNQSWRRSAIDGRTTRHAGYAMSLCLRKRIEEVFGCGTAACPRATGNSLWQWPLMTLSDCPNCWSRSCCDAAIGVPLQLREPRNRSCPQPPSPLHRHLPALAQIGFPNRAVLGALLKLGDLNLTCVPAS